MNAHQQSNHQNTGPTSERSFVQQLGELANFIDAIPTEFREEILLAVFHLHRSNEFSTGYTVTYVRSLFRCCLAARPGNRNSRVSLQGVDLPTVLEGLTPIVVAKDPAQTAIALNGLMDLMMYVSAMTTESHHN